MRSSAEYAGARRAPRRVVVNPRGCQAPSWWEQDARHFVSMTSISVALCLHAFALVGLAVWQEPARDEALPEYTVTILPDIPPVEVCPSVSDGERGATPDAARTECAVAGQRASAPSNYWDFVRAAIAGSVRYPRAAVRQGIEGTIALRLTLDAQGALVAVVPLERSPGLLIESAVSAAWRAAPFPPNTNGSSEVVSAILPVHFQLKRNPERNP